MANQGNEEIIVQLRQSIENYEIQDATGGIRSTQNRGRPGCCINSEQVIFLRKHGMNWTNIARTLNVSRRTLFKYRVTMTVPETRQISDQCLDQILRDILTQTPNAGERYVIGALRANNLRIPRWKVRERLNIIDGEERARRRRSVLRRRIYNVKGPNYLWHIDTNHKLICFRLVFHGCIDGFSRTIIYLDCTTDNTASTALQLFQNGVLQFGLPSRVRTDMGMENILIAQYMLETRGVDRGSCITGKSVHNQRIERLWAEVNRVVSKHYKELFLLMENENILDETDEIDLFALVYVYLPRIQQSLKTFVSQWNYHGLSTEKGFSPLTLWQLGMLHGLNSNDPVYDENPDWYGVEDVLPSRQNGNEDERNDIVVPQSSVQLNREIEDQLIHLVPDPLIDDRIYGIQHYLRIQQYLRQVL